MLTRCPAWLGQRIQHGVDTLRARASRWTQPRPVALASGLAADLARSRGDLLLENMLLRQQVLILRRTVKRPCGGCPENAAQGTAAAGARGSTVTVNPSRSSRRTRRRCTACRSRWSK